MPLLKADGGEPLEAQEAVNVVDQRLLVLLFHKPWTIMSVGIGVEGEGA